VEGTWLVGARQLGPKDRMFDPGRLEASSLFTLVASPNFKIGCFWGPAGVGKSSLVQNGLRGICLGQDWCVVFIPQPRQDPVARCVEVMRSMEAGDAAVASPPSNAEELNALLAKLARSNQPPADRQQVLLVFDQFEQFLIANPDEEARRNLFN